MEYNESATPSSPEGNPVQDSVSVGKVGTDKSGAETTRIETTGTETTGTESARAGTASAKSAGAGTPSSAGVRAEGVSAAEVRAPARPRGPNASAIVVGLVAMIFAGLIIAKEAMDWQVDWSRLGPGAIVGIGVVMVMIGAIGLIRRHDDS